MKYTAAIILALWATNVSASGFEAIPDTRPRGVMFMDGCRYKPIPNTNAWQKVIPDCNVVRDEQEHTFVTPSYPEPDVPGGEDPESDKDHDNNGHGNGDEGDCRGRGCSDPDNPGRGRND